MPPRSTSFAPSEEGGGHKNSSKPQPPPEFQPTQELLSQDERSTLRKVKETFGTLTSALAAITTQVDNLTHNRASQAATLSVQPGTRAGESPTAAPTASFDPNTEEQVQMHIEHRSRSSHLHFLAITNDDEMDGEEEK